MQAIQRILCPTDFSECALVALEQAWELARSFGATLDVLYVYHNPPFIAPEITVGYASTAMGQTLAELMRNEAEAGMQEFGAKAAEKGITLSAQRVVYGDAANTILDVAKNGNYDLIAMGTHGRTGLSHVLLGSVAERVLRRSERPVLTVRHTTEAAKH
ncbi:MAG TPA: universal stress protein [Polyangiaceae bacterium]|nr:universal stress protein [Polyangiaceae bacterium]